MPRYPPRFGTILIHLSDQRLKAVEFLLGAEIGHKGHAQLGPIKVACEIKHIRLDIRVVLAKHGPHTSRSHAVIGPFVLARQHINLHGIDAKLRRVAPVDRHIRRGIPQFAPPLVSSDHSTLDPVQVAQHGGSIFRAPFGQRVADTGRRYFQPIGRNQFGNGDAKAHLGPELGQHRGIARAPLTKAEVRTDRNVRQPKLIPKNFGTKGFRRQRRKPVIEPQFVQTLNTKAFQPMRPRFGVHQAKGWGLRRKILARMRLESHHTQGRVASCCGNFQDGLMA